MIRMPIGGFPITQHQLAAIGSAHVQERYRFLGQHLGHLDLGDRRGPREIARGSFPAAGLATLPEHQQFASGAFLRPPPGVAFRAEHSTGSTSRRQKKR